MENAVEALKMAGSVLLFVIALSIAMLAFSQAREAIDAVLKFSDKEAFTESLIGTDEGNIFYYNGDSKGRSRERKVGLETIIPAMYRSNEESYKVDFKFPTNASGDPQIWLFERKLPGTGGLWEKITFLDFSLEQTKRPITNIEDFMKGLLYNQFDYTVGNFSKTGGGQAEFRKPYYEGGKSLYQKISEWLRENPKHVIIEKLGTYYTEDLVLYEEGTGTTAGAYHTSAFGSEGATENKKTRRIITYEFKTEP